MFHLSNCCCICLNNSVVLNVLQNGNFELFYKLQYCVPELKFDISPLFICEKCDKQIYEMYDFKRVCIANYKVITDMTKWKEAEFISKKSANLSLDLIQSDTNEVTITPIFEQAITCQPFMQHVKEDPLSTNEEIHQISTKQEEISIKTESVADIEQIFLPSHGCDGAFGSRLKDDVSVDGVDIKCVQPRHWETKEELQRQLHTSIDLKEDISLQSVPNVSAIIPDEGKTNRMKEYKCHECDKCFTRASYLAVHERGHRGERPYPCSTCGKRFTQSGALQKHQAVHTGERNYPCTVCGKAFITSGNLLVHIRTHTGEKRYQCNTCSKGFTDLSNLKKHLVVHTGEKRFRCDICGNTFTQSGDLRRHLRIHSGEKPYRCDTCGNEFADLSNLRKHQVVHTGEKRFECDVCHKRFAQASSLSIHKRRTICSFKFNLDMYKINI